LEEECCFPGVLRDGGDAPANLLCQLNGHVVPCASCLHGKWIENVGAGQFGILVIGQVIVIIIIIFEPTSTKPQA